MCIIALGVSSCSQRENVISTSDNLPKSRSEGFVLDYPPVGAMSSHYIVINAMEMAWSQMKNRVLSGNGRAESGFYIRYLFEQNTFSTSLITEGPVAPNCNVAANMILSIPMGDFHLASGFFHCHTSYEKCPPGRYRYTGPSDNDIISADSIKIPGILYDYVAPIIIAGHSTNDPYMVYPFGPDQRPDTTLTNF